MFQTVEGVTRISQRTHMRAGDVNQKTPMTPIHAQLLGALAITAGLLFSMVWLAARMSLIELRRPRRCPACGRLRQHGACGCGA
jgi:hypothetical protein